MTTKPKPKPTPQRGAPLVRPEVPEAPLAITSAPMFPIVMEVEGVPMKLHADGTAEGNTAAIEAKLRDMVGYPNQATLVVWQMLCAARSRPHRPASTKR